MTLKISGIPGSMTNDKLTQLLQPFATIYSAKIIFDQVTQKSKRYALVIVRSSDDAKRLIETYHGKSLCTGQVIKIAEYKPVNSKVQA